MNVTFLTILALGLTLGIKHALDADHVVALSTMVSDHKHHPLKAATVGVLWGLGHTITLFLVGLGVIVFKITIPVRLSLSFEFTVGILLVLLGIQTLRKYKRRRIHIHSHHHDGQQHSHFHAHETNSSHKHGHSIFRYKSLLIGMVHGLAGSAALMLLVLGTIQSSWQGIAYILVFGAGSIVGMLVVSTLISLPFVVSAERFKSFNHKIQLLAGIMSIALGAFVIGKIGFVEGLIYKL